jgi:hypothetical protein
MTNYRTVVCLLPATPMGMLPERWSIIGHWCRTCHQKVDTDQLIEHAKSHESRVDSNRASHLCTDRAQ